MRTTFAGLPLLAAALWLGQTLFAQEAARPRAGATTVATHQFRIVVGLADREPKDWTGALRLTGGEIAAVDGWRFSQDDRVGVDGSFQFRTKIGNLEDQLNPDRPYGQTDWGDPKIRRLIPQGLIVRFRGSESTRVAFDSGAGSFQFTAGETGWRPLAKLDGNARVEQLPLAERISETGAADDEPSLAIAPDGQRWVAWLSYEPPTGARIPPSGGSAARRSNQSTVKPSLTGENAGDRVMVRGAGRLDRLTAKGDHHSPVIAADGKGRVHAVWSRNDDGVFQLYTSVHESDRWAAPVRLTDSSGSNLWPRLAADGAGRLALVWQAFRNSQSVILARVFEGAGWGRETVVSSGPGNCWTPATAFGGGKLWIAWDSYATGSYQVHAKEWNGGIERVTPGESFSVRPSVAVTSTGAPIIAWEESDAMWGKDFAFLADRRGTTLYKNRRVRVAARQEGRWLEIGAPVAESLPPQTRRFVQQPQLALDPAGRLHLAFRSRTSAGTARMDYWASAGRWETFLTSLDGDRWTTAIPMPSSLGRNSMRASIAAAGDEVHVAWPTDHRVWPGGRYGDLDVYAASVAARVAPARWSGGRPLAAEPSTASNPHPNENADTARIRNFRITINGKTYRIVRGDLHRHTELSGDGAGDGSLDDLYRYALDAAQMDYAHVGDHQMGNDEEYNWWITQKSNDLYHLPGRFVVMYGYERSVWWPNGHRNVVWATRGKPVLRIGEPERKGEANSGPILYPYLRETAGIATSHTSATEQGTDWRDNDPELEPIVEIYQGFESSYEHAGAPRAWKEGEKAVHQGPRPQGYIWAAWAKGYKLGVQASSDHVSTHASYASILVEEFTRAGLLDAIRRRHTYAATDSIILDYRVETSAGWSLMGDIASSDKPPKLAVGIVGTAPIRQVDVIRNNTYIHKLTPEAREVRFEYADPAIPEGESYYYIRAEQADGQLAWSSPVWVRYKKQDR